jgi:hypothetical protein
VEHSGSRREASSLGVCVEKLHVFVRQPHAHFCTKVLPGFLLWEQ